MIGKHCWEVVHGTTQPIHECPLLRVKKSLSRESVELQIGRRWFAVSVDPILDDIRKISGFVHIVSDITGRKQAEEELRQSNENLSKIVKTTPDASCITRVVDGIFLQINQAFTDITGYAPEELLGRSSLPGGVALWTKAEDRDRMVAELRTMGEVNGMEMSLRIKGGSIRISLLSARILDINGEKCILTIAHDITERKRMEEALKRSETLFSSAFKMSPAATILSNLQDGMCIDANEAYARLVGFSRDELVGKTTTELNIWMSADDRNRAVSGLAQAGRLQNVPITLRKKDGSLRSTIASGDIVVIEGMKCILSFFFDITERKQAEEAIQRTAKLESLGVLAGGIAHDFNNLLTGIYGYIDLARSVTKDVREKEYLETTLATMNRAKALTLQLLTFAKGGSPVRKITPIIPFIRETAQFALSGSNISCRFLLAEDLWLCNIDRNQIGQVIDNIVINAQQAMPDGGTIEITAVNLSFGENEHPILSKADYVKVSIRDFGIGIPKEIMPRIFDPFYTTKTKGHGLGLATCYSIINRHGGCIDVESEPGKGSTFHIYLPASSEAIVPDAGTISKHKGSGTIIVVDDEKVVRETIRKMLESLGYTVVCKNDGREAIDFFINETRVKKTFAAMIFDLTIPGGMGGIEAVKEIRKMDAGAEIPVFVVSGYADNSVMTNPGEYGFTASISKPFTIEELSEMLNKNID
jgi:PAS domain S-box-containing protein